MQALGGIVFGAVPKQRIYAERAAPRDRNIFPAIMDEELGDKALCDNIIAGHESPKGYDTARIIRRCARLQAFKRRLKAVER